MRIGCISLVPRGTRYSDLFVTINCSRERGIILPGGKIESGETFKQCASRELFEETGLTARKQDLIFQAPSHANEDFYVLCFLTKIDEYTPRNSTEGTVELNGWDALMQSKYKGYYELLRDAYGSWKQRALD